MLIANHLCGFGSGGDDKAVNFPVVAATNTSIENSPVTSHDVSLPASIAAGDLLIMLMSFAIDVAVTATGWSPLYNFTSTKEGFAFYKVATGSEGATFVVTTDVSSHSAHNTYRINTYRGIPEAQTSASNDPPNLSPSWGSDKTLWIATGIGTPGMSDTPPTNYANGLTATAGVTINAKQVSGRRTLEAASENPGTWTSASGTATIAVRGL